MTDDVKNTKLEKAHNLILLSLTDQVLREVGEVTTIVVMWKMMEDKFQKKSLTNRLYQKQLEAEAWRESKRHTCNNSLSKSKKVRCYKCKEVEHIRKNCPQLKKDKNSNAATVVVRSSATVSGESSNEEDGKDVLTVSTTGSDDTWFMDTGASYHMTFNRELFSSFKEWNGSVKLSDDEELGVNGCGVVQIKMYDGMVRTFNVW
ncbi:Zinc finger, CCHC-type [Sesbania bispinosa]|nr:Zinc finger, CCHC-type [Sesbania bispinosa]